MDALQMVILRQAQDDARALERRLATLDHEPVGSLGLNHSEIKKYSLLRAIGAMVQMHQQGGFGQLDGLEGETHRALVAKHGEPQSLLAFHVPAEILHRDLTVASVGSYLVGSTTGGSFIEALRNKTVSYRLGAQALPGQRADLLLPRQSASATGYWLGNEGTQVTESQPTLQQVVGQPRTVGGYTEISGQLLKQSNPSAEALVTADLGAVVGIALDAGVINGSGVSGQPAGILNTSGIGSVSGTSLAYAGILEFQSDVLASNGNVNDATLGWATTPTIAKLLAARFKNTEISLWDGPLARGTISGMPAISTLQVPAATMIFGDWSSVLIPEWGVLTIEVNPYANFQALIVGLRALYTCDVIIRHPESFSVATSIT